MAKRDQGKSRLVVHQIDPTECPFREFRDNELSQEFWGMGPAAFRITQYTASKVAVKPAADYVWVDEQTQPLPRSARQFLHGWIRAEELAMRRWEAEAVVFEDNGDGKMSVMNIQFSHAQVMLRSSFCRKVLSICYILERADNVVIEHQWENFVAAIPPEGWRARYHIYSPGLKPGGGQQHRPTLSKNGCYLVRLFYLGAWRCVWVSDLVPVDATDSPLLPFSPLICQAPRSGTKQPAATVTSSYVHLWPLLLCKALLKLAAPDMSSDEDIFLDDEPMMEFDILHAMTGALNITYTSNDPERLWKLITSEVPLFFWDDDDDTLTSTVKSKNTKKQTTKETAVVRRGSMTTIFLEDTKNLPNYALPGISPGHEMNMLVTMARDLPLKKPLPEPEVATWKTYRWVDWARNHGLYEAFDCPRTRFLKVNGLMKLSYAPHLLDVQSTESITFQFREEHDKTNPPTKKGMKDLPPINNSSTAQQAKEEMREWVQFSALQESIKHVTNLFYPSMYQYASLASNPPSRITKVPISNNIDIHAPNSAPLYLQIDGPDENVLRISLNVLQPRVLINCGVPIFDDIEPAYLILEVFEWFADCTLPMVKAYIETREYNSLEIELPPGRHCCRIWVHSRMNWHAMFLSGSSLLLGTRDVIQCSAVKECPWASRFLSILGTAFSNWIRMNKSTFNMAANEKDFFKSYQPDLEWDPAVVGYEKCLLHWMFRQALQSLLLKRLLPDDFRAVCTVLRQHFCDPDFGMPPKPKPPKSFRGIADMDPCDCVMPEVEEIEAMEEVLLEEQVFEENPIIDPQTMKKLLSSPEPPSTSQVCDLASEDLPCGILKREREMVIRKHEAATCIQAFWRGTWARKCLTDHVLITSDVLKMIMEYAFGNLEALSALMNEFFLLYPGAKYAYSVASGLSGVLGLHQYSGTSPATYKCKWIPYFQGVFTCHAPVKVHLDVQSSLPYSTFAVYNNDTGKQMPQVYNAHITFHFTPNDHGYTIMGHGTLNEAPGANSEVQWQLTVLSSIADVFHICDNDMIESCRELPLPQSSKVHIDEIFIPNRRNILGGIQISVQKEEYISFRAAATSPELEMEAILSTISSEGGFQELGRCSGIGVLQWPYIKLESAHVPYSLRRAKTRSATSHANLTSAPRESVFSSARSLKTPRAPKASTKSKSMTKIKDIKPLEPKQYTIKVTARNGWPLTLAQWNRVNEVRNMYGSEVVEVTPKKPQTKDKDKNKTEELYQPQPGDAYVELECFLAVGGGSQAKRDDERDLQFAAERKSWDIFEPGRNLRGAQIRKEFRAEFLEALPPPPSESSQTIAEEIYEELEGEEKKDISYPAQQGPTPVTESGTFELSTESEKESTYLTMPEQLKDKFETLYFVPLCTKEIESIRVTLTPAMLQAAVSTRNTNIEAALQRMSELQTYNEAHVLGRQKHRCQLLEKLFVDSQWKRELNEALEERDDAIAREALNRTLSATKKKMEAKKK